MMVQPRKSKSKGAICMSGNVQMIIVVKITNHANFWYALGLLNFMIRFR